MKRILRAALGLIAAYLVGIGAAIAVTPAELTLAGRTLWPYYPVLAVPGYGIFYLGLSEDYLFGAGTATWIARALGLAGVLGGIAALTLGRGPARRWGARLIALTLGFIGTLGVYYAVAASV